MRILHISTRLILGGSQENTILSCEGQARLGHDVHLAYGPIYGPEGSMLSRVGTFNAVGPHRITTHLIPDLVRQISPLRDRRALAQLRTLIRTLRPDIVHTHSSKAGILGRLAPPPRGRGLGGGRATTRDVDSLKQRHNDASLGAERTTTGTSPSPRIIHTIHGPPFMPIEGGLITRLRTRLTNYVYTLAERKAARRCDTIVSVADAMTAQFLARGIGRPEQYTTIRSGMETDTFLMARPGETRPQVRARLGLSEADFVVGTVARLAQHKGHDDLLEALCSDLNANPRWKLLWVGDGWWRERLLHKARTLGLTVRELDRDNAAPSAAAQLILTGLVPPDHIPGLVRCMDVLAHPSYREGLPRTVPQALLAGVCPVAYDVDGTGEICRDMQTGRLVPPGDNAALREAIAWCHANPGERRALAERGREECRTAFSTETMIAALERVYTRA